MCSWGGGDAIQGSHNHEATATDWSSPMPQVRNQELKVKASGLHSCFFPWIRKRIKWNIFIEARAARSQEYKNPSTANTWTLSGSARLNQRPLSQFFPSQHMISREQSCGIFMWLCIWCMCVYMCLCIWKWTMCICIWRPKINSSHLSPWLSTLFFETETLTKPGTHQVARLAGPLAPGICLSLPPSTGITDPWNQALHGY